MNIAAFFKKISKVGACGLGAWLLLAHPSAAQTRACVYLTPGSGYAAWMGVKFGDSYYWSDSFPIGETRCISLPVPGMVNGAPYDVVVSAVLGSSKVLCTPSPSPYSSGDHNTVTYLAWGTTLNVTCQMPGASGAEGSLTPTKEGLEALEKQQKEGAKPYPK
jgi:hypothetical protein